MRGQWYLLVGLHMGLELITRELIKLVRGRPADAGLIVCARVVMTMVLVIPS